MNKTVLVIGITGGIGGAFASVCLKRRWHVKALHRNPVSAKLENTHLTGVEWIEGDAMCAEDVVSAANGVDTIFHGANPPGYKNWRGLALPMLQNSIGAAVHHQIRLVFPGNVYNFGPGALPLVSENSPQNPETRKGTIRVEMEQILQEATLNGAKALIVRAGDFFGPGAKGSWFPQAMVKPGKKLKSIVYPGRHDVGHAWAYLPDLAETMVQLLERENALAPFEVFHFGGHYFPQGVSIARKTLSAAGLPDGPIRKMPWIILKLSSPLVSMFRELLEMRYLWEKELQLDSSKLVKFLGNEPHTKIEDALKNTLHSLRCL